MQTTYHNITQEKVQRQDKKLCIKTKYFKLTKNKENLYGTPGALLVLTEISTNKVSQ